MRKCEEKLLQYTEKIVCNLAVSLEGHLSLGSDCFSDVHLKCIFRLKTNPKLEKKLNVFHNRVFGLIALAGSSWHAFTFKSLLHLQAYPHLISPE